MYNPYPRGIRLKLVTLKVQSRGALTRTGAVVQVLQATTQGIQQLTKLGQEPMGHSSTQSLLNWVTEISRQPSQRMQVLCMSQ